MVAGALHTLREDILDLKIRLLNLLFRHHPFAAGGDHLFELSKFILRDFDLSLADDETTQALCRQVDTGDNHIAVRRFYLRAGVRESLPCLVIGLVLVAHTAHEPAADPRYFGGIQR